MKLLVIPDIHLKPWIFDKAFEILRLNTDLNGCVVLGDLVDDFGQKYNLDLYKDTFDAAIKFATTFPSTLWCYGNHDVSYVYQLSESGYSSAARDLVCLKLRELQHVVGENYNYVHMIDNVIFSHGGLNAVYVSKYVPLKYYKYPEYVLSIINQLHIQELWRDLSPLWFRPQIYYGMKPYYPRKYLQVVGHTPVKKIGQKHGILSCDSFSTHVDGTPYGEQKFVIVDTVTKEWYKID